MRNKLQLLIYSGLTVKMDFSWILHSTLRLKILQDQLSISMITIPFPSFMVCAHISEMFITYYSSFQTNYM